MSPGTPSIVLSQSPLSSRPPSPQLPTGRPSPSGRSASWSPFGDYSMAADRRSTPDTASAPGDVGSTLSALVQPDGAIERMRIGTSSQSVSPRTSLDVGRRSSSASPSRATPTPLSAMDKVFNVPASEGLSDRLKELAKQTDTTVLEVLRRLSEAERQSALSKAASSKSELTEFFKTFLDFNEVDINACVRLNLPIATWEHVADQVKMEGGARANMIMSLYWRAKHRRDRMEHYRETGRTSG